MDAAEIGKVFRQGAEHRDLQIPTPVGAKLNIENAHFQDVARVPSARNTPAGAPSPTSQLRSAPPSRLSEIGPCSAPTRPSSTDHPATSPAKKAIIPLQLMSP